ncbi:hypothetical protein BN2475_470196 [Paraburkholderia ribeironis]|uniref:Uncharacterized protein n=1 Tax=Paraburkholderia ribeironis TaxID=1247936 RepID=A0A1N7SBX9_9BURK|nr:hypothetical protein BN2475_470196 [Paraburkholderia ribeironis]
MNCLGGGLEKDGKRLMFDGNGVLAHYARSRCDCTVRDARGSVSVRTFRGRRGGLPMLCRRRAADTGAAGGAC